MSLQPRGSQPPQGGHRPVPAPGDHSVRQGGQPLQGVRILGGHRKGVQPGGQPGLPLGVSAVSGRPGSAPGPRGGALIRLRFPVSSPSRALNRGSPGWLPGGYVEEHPQGLNQGPAKGPLHLAPRPQVPQLQLEPLLQGLPAKHPPHRPQLLQQRAGWRVLGQQRRPAPRNPGPGPGCPPRPVPRPRPGAGRTGSHSAAPPACPAGWGSSSWGRIFSPSKHHEKPSPFPSSSARTGGASLNLRHAHPAQNGQVGGFNPAAAVLPRPEHPQVVGDHAGHGGGPVQGG